MVRHVQRMDSRYTGRRMLKMELPEGTRGKDGQGGTGHAELGVREEDAEDRER